MFAQEIAAALPGLRAAAESRMTSRARVRRQTGAYVKDADGYDVPEWVDVIAETPFRLSGSRGASRSRTQDVEGVEVEIPQRTGHFPHGTTGLADGDFIEVTSGDSAGVVVRIIEAALADQQTAVRVPVEGVTRPTEWGA